MPLVERYDLVDVVNKDYLVRGLKMMLDDIERNDNKLLNPCNLGLLLISEINGWFS